MSYLKMFRFEGLPKTINAIGRSHWSLKKKEADYWNQAIFLMTRGKVPKTPLKRAKVTYTRYSSRPCDYDGLVSSFKQIQDAFVRSGVLENDTMKHVIPTYLWIQGKQRAGYVTILIEELREA